MTRKKEEPLILCLNHLLPEQEYIEQKAVRLAKQIRERKAKKHE